MKLYKVYSIIYGLLFFGINYVMAAPGSYFGVVPSTSAGTSTMTLAGYIGVSSNSSNNQAFNIYLDGVNTKEGIGTVNPGQTLDVRGTGGVFSGASVVQTLSNSQFIGGAAAGGLIPFAGAYNISQGPNTSTKGGYAWIAANSDSSGGATRMTMDASGNVGIGTTSPGSLFTVSNSTLTVNSAGDVNAPSQPRAFMSRVNAQNLSSNAFTDIYWDTTDDLRNLGFNQSTSSNTLTINVAGFYLIHCMVGIANNTTQVSQMRILINANIKAENAVISTNPNGYNQSSSITTVQNLAVNDTIKCRILNTVSASTVADGNMTNIKIMKLW